MTNIKQLDYRRAVLNRLDIDIYQVSDLRRRVGDERLQSTFQYNFHLLMGVTKGECVQVIDFNSVRCAAGSLLSIRPAQAHRLAFDREWDGWMVMFRPEFLLSSQTSLPLSDLRLAVGFEGLVNHMLLEQREFQILTGTVDRMREDMTLATSSEHIHALLRHQLYELMLRLTILCDQRREQEQSTSKALSRFKSFQKLVEQNFVDWHQVADYADALACSQKSLTRATLEVTGASPKSFISSRVNLEAKRLLVQSDATISTISGQLGFDDTTSFVKFFKRETGLTPGEFRRRQIAESLV